MTLAQALQIAAANNLTYQASLDDQRAAAARVISADGGKVPSLSVSGAREHTQSAGAFVFQSPKGESVFPISATNYWSVDETIQWAIYTGGAVEAGMGAGPGQALIASWRLVRGSYWRVVGILISAQLVCLGTPTGPAPVAVPACPGGRAGAVPAVTHASSVGTRARSVVDSFTALVGNVHAGDVVWVPTPLPPP